MEEKRQARPMQQKNKTIQNLTQKRQITQKPIAPTQTAQQMQQRTKKPMQQQQTQAVQSTAMPRERRALQIKKTDQGLVVSFVKTQ